MVKNKDIRNMLDDENWYGLNCMAQEALAAASALEDHTHTWHGRNMIEDIRIFKKEKQKALRYLKRK